MLHGRYWCQVNARGTLTIELLVCVDSFDNAEVYADGKVRSTVLTTNKLQLYRLTSIQRSDAEQFHSSLQLLVCAAVQAEEVMGAAIKVPATCLHETPF